ncbi:hypothetical protein [Streptomyces albidoflavus]|uniref:hypothetical protein n=1 Tax=Streptomyces albidoflavus TaxID=1886 RepID=UPI0033ADBA27
MGEPSPLRQVAVAVLLFVVDLVVIASLVYIYGWAGWADNWDPANPPEAPGIAWWAVWILAGGAVATGVGLFVLRWRIPGAVQLSVLGLGAILFAHLAVRGR